MGFSVENTSPNLFSANVLNSTNHLWAAIDLGSNSFHLLIVRRSGDSFVVVERLKEKVQLLSGFENGAISPASWQRGRACLARFAQRLRPLQVSQITVMGTSVLRRASNALEFIAEVEAVLGVPCEVISGAQEAELIFAAVRHHVPSNRPTDIVIDIGGGSTEIAFGNATHATARPGIAHAANVSANIGCVILNEECFAGVEPLPVQYSRAKEYAVELLQDVLQNHLGTLPTEIDLGCYGTSGTIDSIQTVLVANGWSSDRITAEALTLLERAIVDNRWVIDVGLPGLAPDRTDIFPAGVAILSACFSVLGITQLQFVKVSLLQGMILDAIEPNQLLQNDEGNTARAQHGERAGEVGVSQDAPTESMVNRNMNKQSGAVSMGSNAGTPEQGMSQSLPSADLREDSVNQLAARFAVDIEQAHRVEILARDMVRQAAAWFDNLSGAERMISWAARLHEVGAHISARHYHRHGSYVIKHAELPGFTEMQQSSLSLLVRGHRRSMPGLAFRAYDEDAARTLLRLVAILRIAVILQRSHSDADSPNVQISVTDDQLSLDCGQLSANESTSWLSQHPLSSSELQVEIEQLAREGILLDIR